MNLIRTNLPPLQGSSRDFIEKSPKKAPIHIINYISKTDVKMATSQKPVVIISGCHMVILWAEVPSWLPGTGVQGHFGRGKEVLPMEATMFW